MLSQKKIVIGLFGFGVVGEGLYKVLKQTPSLNAQIKKVCIKNIEKKREAPTSLFTTNKNELLFDKEINVIVEVINETEAAFEIVSIALLNGKHVVSASKKMLAEHLEELLILQQQTGKSLLYEAAACASIPVIRNLEEYYDNDLLHSIQAIVNGSSNFILTKMFDDKLDFSDALKQAQQLGFAESDPALDIEGYDALHKWVLLLNHAYGIVTTPDEIVFSGITNITAQDAAFAKEHGFEIKLVAQAKKLTTGKVAAFVLPQFVKKDEPLSFVKNEYNGVVIESAFADKQFFYGKGAGSFPTASAVLSDIAALRYNYKYEYKKLYQQPLKLTDNFFVKAYISYEDESHLPLFINELENKIKLFAGRNTLKVNLPFSLLQESDWWKKNNISLILFPKAVVENKEQITSGKTIQEFA